LPDGLGHFFKSNGKPVKIFGKLFSKNIGGAVLGFGFYKYGKQSHKEL